jgi:HEAT repeat protein
VPQLNDRYKKIRLIAIQSLAEAGEQAHAQLFARLLPLLDDSDADIRKSALACLAKLGPVQPADRAGLETGLLGKSIEIRVYCLESLGALGQDALASIPLIARRLSDPDAAVRLAAAKALGRFGKASAEVVEVLLRARRDDDPAVRLEAIKDLGNLIREQGVLQALFDSLSEPNAAIHEAVGKAIRAAQPPLGKNELPILAANLKAVRPEARRLAASELARIGADAEPILADLVQTLKDSDSTVRRHGCTALAALGPKAKQAEPILTETLTAILKDDAREPGALDLFREAATALGKIEKPDAAVPFWVTGLKSRNPTLRKEAMQSLSTVGEPARRALPELCALLGDRELGPAASETIVRLGGPEAVKELARIVDNGPAPARLIAIKMLGKMGPDAKPALGALYRAVNYYKGREAGEAARRAIAAINKK